ncbi:MAG: acetylglutamate kinase [Bdellovibrionales bacterium]|nr:acetylglutamate kinase [Bdellovibrionales bacterium]
MIVIKLGGAALKATLSDPRLFAALAECREPLVIVHGGGPEINQLCEKLGITFEFVDGQRVTSPAVMQAVEMVLTGKINPALVRGLLAAGRAAVGLSGVSGNLLHCVPENPALGLVGKVERVETQWIHQAVNAGAIPVVSPVGLLHDFQPCNVNADLATARMAIDLKATRVLFLTDKDGILDAGGSTVKRLSAESLRAMMSSGTVSGGMKVKARAILEVIEANAACSVEVMNGLDPQTLRDALRGASGGTLISS